MANAGSTVSHEKSQLVAVALCLLRVPLPAALFACDSAALSAFALSRQPAVLLTWPSSGLLQVGAIDTIFRAGDEAAATVSPWMREMRQTERDVAAVRDMDAEEVCPSPNMLSVCMNESLVSKVTWDVAFHHVHSCGMPVKTDCNMCKHHLDNPHVRCTNLPGASQGSSRGSHPCFTTCGLARQLDAP